MPEVLTNRHYRGAVAILEGLPINQRTLKIKIPPTWAPIDNHAQRAVGRHVLNLREYMYITIQNNF